MEKHKKFKRPHKAASLDGFVSDGRQLGMPTNKSYQPIDNDSSQLGLGNYDKKMDGFHPIRQAPRELSATPEAEERAALLNEPIVLEDFGSKRKKQRKHPRARRRIKRAMLGMASLLIIVSAYFAFKVYITQKHLFRGGGGAPALAENINIDKLKGEGDGRINILLLGIGGIGHQGGDLTDTMLIMSIDPVNNNAALLSLPRDLWVKIPGDGYQKINAAYPYGKEGSRSKKEKDKISAGLASLDKTLEPVIGIPIHYHSIVDFKAFKQGVDAVGGVTFNVPEALYDPTVAWENKGNPYIAKKGVQTLNGQQALLYARSRETSSDFARGQRQRQLILALKEKLFSLGTLSNPVKASSVLDSFGNNVYTDFSVNDIMRLQQIFGKIPSNKIGSLDLTSDTHNLVTTANMNGLSIVRPRAGLTDYSEIQSYVRNALKDSFIAKENSQIAIYNSTSIVGLATASSNKLKSYGYNVTVVDNTPTESNQPITTIVDFSKGKDKYTRNYLEKRFKVRAINSLNASFGVKPPTGTTFVIILGKDAANSSQTSFAN
jgi:polyisoprenyl-teichoic acid--peptidoglycan teichoic acid transferase